MYTVTQSKDPEMFEFWSEYTVRGKKTPMLVCVIHTDCLDYSVVEAVKYQGDAKIEFQLKG